MKWLTVALGEVVTFQRGFDLASRLRRSGDVPVVSSAGLIDHHTIAMVEAPGVVTGRYGTIGELFYIEKPFWPLNTTLYIRDFRGNDPRFIYYHLHRFDFTSFSGKSGVPGVNRNDLHAEEVSIPTDLDEQRDIAQVLGDVDALLKALVRLIAKKHDLKQATMHQLLTGQTRLAGFSGGWKETQLGKLFTFKNGLNKGKKWFGFGTPIVNYMDVFSNSVISCSRLEGRVSLTSDELRNYEVRRGDVLFTRTSETPEEVGMSSVILDEPSQTVFSGFVLRGRPKGEALCDSFKAYCFRSSFVRAQIISKASYTTRALTNGKILSLVVLDVPLRPEQEAIASVLTDMDAEIAALKQRLTKTRALKQGMMQELLTGRIRLVAPEGPRA